MPPDAQLTTPIIWICTAILAVTDVLLGLLAWRKVSPQQIYSMRWLLAFAGGIFFLIVWSIVLLWGWDWFYAYVFPAWARTALPPIFCIGYATLARGMGWLSLKLPGNPALSWSLLGGLEGLLSHLYAIYGLGAASNPPTMRGTDPLAVLIFAIFEKAFYWILILLVCWLLSTKLLRKMNLAKPVSQ